MAIWNPVRLTAMHHKHVALGAAMVERDGWRQPARYTTVEQELERLRAGAGLSDISPLGKLLIQGDELDTLLLTCFDAVTSLEIGIVARRSAPKGKAPAPVVLARLAQDEVMALTGPGQAQSLAEALAEEPGRCAKGVDLTSALAGARITGPSAGLLLESITELDLSPAGFPDLRCARSKVAEVHGTLLRMDIRGLPSFDLYFGREFGEYLWDVLMEAGAEYGVAPVGIEAMARLQ
jgi:sarcosine oxidase subunit alpha